MSETRRMGQGYMCWTSFTSRCLRFPVKNRKDETEGVDGGWMQCTK